MILSDFSIFGLFKLCPVFMLLWYLLNCFIYYKLSNLEGICLVKGYRIHENSIRKNGLISDSNYSYKEQKHFNINHYIKTEEENITLDGNQLIASWFSSHEDRDIFISHSHADIGVVNKFASYLTDLGKKPFVDYNFWGNSEALIKSINEEYNLIKGEVDAYYYTGSQVVSSNVLLMLITSLNKMIANCPIFIFIDTDNSLEGRATYSPWIMEELNTFKMLYEKQLADREETLSKKRAFDNEIKVTYDVEEIISMLITIESEKQLKNNLWW